MENKKVNASQVALYVVVGLGVVSVVGGLTYFVRRLWNSEPVEPKLVNETPVSLELLETQNNPS